MTPFGLRARLRVRVRALLERVLVLTRPMEEPAVESETATDAPVLNADGGWTHKGVTVSPDDCQPWAVDRGQHDGAKQALRVALHRFETGHAGAVFDLRSIGITDPTVNPALPVGPLFPVEATLAATCRRLGFARLARAACPLAEEAPTTEWLDAARTGLLLAFHEANEATVRAEAQRRFDVCRANEANPEIWHPSRGPMPYASVEETIALLTLGSFDGPELPPGKVAAELLPFVPQS